MICSAGVDFRENFEKKNYYSIFKMTRSVGQFWLLVSAAFGNASTLVENNAKESGTQGIESAKKECPSN